MNEFEKNAFIGSARKLAERCISLRLSGIEVFHGLKISQMAAMYDGIGPEWKSRVIAEVFRHMDQIFEPAGFVQDLQFKILGDRSEESFHRCNRQFLENCLKCVSAEVPFWRFLKRRRLRKSAGVLFRACEDHGWDSWKNHGRSLPEF